MIRDFGVLLAVGIVILVIVGIIVPGSRARRARAQQTDARASRRACGSSSVVVKLGSLPTKVAPIIALVGVGLFVGGVLVESDTKIESDPIKWISQDSDVVKDVERLEDETGFSTTLGILVQANNVYDQHVIDLIWDFTLDAEARDEVVTSSSLVNTMGKILMIPGATPIAPERDRHLRRLGGDARGHRPGARPLRAADVADAPAAGQPADLAPASLEERAVLVDELEADLQQRIDALDIPAGSILLEDLPPGQEPVRAVPAGLATVGIGLLENLSANRAALTYLALSLAGLYLVLRTRSLGRAVLALVPVFLAIGISSLAGLDARHHAQSADHRVGAAGRRQRGRVLGADHGPPHRGTPGRARPGRRHPHRRPPYRPRLLHVGADDHRRVRAC